eukprot:GHVP01068742.1.p2 GENE.GHVP01068742.1~~GHVP01068742.1.p2  ORF type:complete len:434 (+),score=134.17 GHVP01068742.1:1104-2405(+)
MEGENATAVNFWELFRNDAFYGYSNDENGFFAVYRRAFCTLFDEEPSSPSSKSAPDFGWANSPWESTSRFYSFWTGFVSERNFHGANVWRISQAESRAERRVMEAENERKRRAARKEFQKKLDELVRHVKKRDPRVTAHTKIELVEKKEREKLREQKKLEDLQKAREARLAARTAEEERWKKEDEERAARGECDEESESGEENVTVIYGCDFCKKYFKSKGASDAHEKSKKHIQKVKQLIASGKFVIPDGDVTESEASDEKEGQGDEEEAQSDQNDDKEAQSDQNDEEEAQSDQNDEEAQSDQNDEEAQGQCNVEDQDGNAQELKRTDGNFPDESPYNERRYFNGRECIFVDSKPLDEKKHAKEESRKRTKERKPRRRKDKEPKESEKHANTNTGNPNNKDRCCRVCKAKFTSKNKLFEHLAREGHMHASGEK